MGKGAYGAFNYYQYQKLSSEDKAKVNKIIEDTVSQLLPLQNELRAERLTLDNLLWSSNPDKSKINESIDKIANLQKQMLQIRSERMLEINKILQTANESD